MRQTSLLLGIHNHQPEGNFPHVLAEACDKSYLPFLEVAKEYPDFHFSAHFSGGLLDWIQHNRPRIIELIAEMVGRGQIEMIGAGDHEPVLAIIPQEDRIGQIKALNTRTEDLFNQTPQGAWLTERVWEATVVPALAKADMKFVMVDDYHFFCAGYEANQMDGYYHTEEDGHQIDIFPISEALRYRLPFAPVHEAVAYLESLASEDDHAAVCFDDGEKFGIWPETYDWVYNQGWLHQFMQAVCGSELIQAKTFTEYRATNRSKGICYLPTTSYIEMGEWSLPPKSCEKYEQLIQKHRHDESYDYFKPFLRGGIWKNFLVKYPESGWMHKRMLKLSARLSQADIADKTDLYDMLYRAQANDAFWHGMFGGLYHPHLRRGLYRQMLKLESALDEHSPRVSFESFDLDMDAQDESLLHNDQQQIVVQAHAGGIIREWDLYAVSHNLGDALRRHPEAYHAQARQGSESNDGGDGLASIHDRVSFIHEISPEDLETDSHARGSATDLLVINGETQDCHGDYQQVAQTDDAFTLQLDLDDLQLQKTFSLQDTILSVSYQLSAKADVELSFTSQWNLAMPSCDGPAGCYHNTEALGGFGEVYELCDSASLKLTDDVLQANIRLNLSQAANIKLSPLRTVSRSEAGFEKIMQAAVIEPTWTLNLSKGESWDVVISFDIEAY
ncbi:MAG: DUF1926 domain-containing protein [Mariprofundaceae bacterium]|nr:DUF1926 domain-containing protein [Mariprofundaceae bacterium]